MIYNEEKTKSKEKNNLVDRIKENNSYESSDIYYEGKGYLGMDDLDKIRRKKLQGDFK